MRTKKRLYTIISIWGVMIASIAISCQSEEQEDRIVGDTFASLSVGIVDKYGNDLVEEWRVSESENKLTEAEHEELTKYPHSSKMTIYYWTNDKEHRYDFAYTPVLNCLEVGDSLSWRFKMYEGDAEELLFEGKCKSDKGRPVTNFGKCLNRNIQWYFRGKELPFETNVDITLVRSEDGRYSLKE